VGTSRSRVVTSSSSSRRPDQSGDGPVAWHDPLDGDGLRAAPRSRRVAKAPFTGSRSYGGGTASGLTGLVRRTTRGDHMGLGDKAENMKDDMVGKAKEGAGKATDNERLEAEGQVDQSKADLKQAGENVKDAFKN
jgi:uncharacterized protein YjbJ (UPF0337 family)